MTREDIVEMLKKNLRVEVSVRERQEWDDKVRTRVKVRILFDGELITEDDDSA